MAKIYHLERGEIMLKEVENKKQWLDVLNNNPMIVYGSEQGSKIAVKYEDVFCVIAVSTEDLKVTDMFDNLICTTFGPFIDRIGYSCEDADEFRNTLVKHQMTGYDEIEAKEVIYIDFNKNYEFQEE